MTTRDRLACYRIYESDRHMTVSNYIGEMAALGAALLWAISFVYSRLGLEIPPLQLNLYKGIIAIAIWLSSNKKAIPDLKSVKLINFGFNIIFDDTKSF